MIENRPIRNGQHKARRHAHIVHAGFILCRRRVLGLHHGSRHVAQLHGSAQVHADRARHALAGDISRKLINGHHGGIVLSGHRHSIGDVVSVAVRQQNIVDLRGQNIPLRIFWIPRNERIDENIGSLGGLDQDRRVAKPGDARSLE